MLSGKEIIKEVASGNIKISDFDEKNIQPNGYELHLGNVLLTPDEESFQLYLDKKTLEYRRVWDWKKPIAYKEIIIPEEGYILEKGRLYLGVTKERIGTDKYVPELKDKSSFAREGKDLRKGAGFGDIGWEGYFTVEITTDHDAMFYPNEPICQVIFHNVEGDLSLNYKEMGNYNDQPAYPVPSTRFKKYTSNGQ